MTLPLHVPLHVDAGTKQRAVRTTFRYDGPHPTSVEGEAVKVTLLAPVTLTLDSIVTLVRGGAHLNESAAKPDPVLPRKVIARGFVAHIAFGCALEAKPTEMYAPIMPRLIVRPTSRCGRYLLIKDNRKSFPSTSEFKNSPPGALMYRMLILHARHISIPVFDRISPSFKYSCLLEA